MNPPILQWKVSLALLGVVIGGVILGSALHTNKPEFPAALVHAGSVTMIASAHGKTVPIKPINPCAKPDHTLTKAQKSMLRLFKRQVCHQHH